MTNMNYARPQIQAMTGYVPGEQPRSQTVIKLNTNENPYPPAPAVFDVLKTFDCEKLRRYPDPTAMELRELAALKNNLPNAAWVLAGNGSDDLLTIAMRTFLDPGEHLAFPWPTYSLYPVLAQIQDVQTIAVPLTDSFELPKNFLNRLEAAKLLFLARPNAPTGNAFPMARIREICQSFNGIVWLDEAYADFAADNCMSLIEQFDNVVVSRTLSKSASLAGLRLGLAFANPAIIAEMMKVKDSYNVSMLTQELAKASIADSDYTRRQVEKIRHTRSDVTHSLRALNFHVLDSQANFIFAKPPTDAAAYVEYLKSKNVFVRYFPAPETAEYVRVTIGSPEQMHVFLDHTRDFLNSI